MPARVASRDELVALIPPAWHESARAQREADIWPFTTRAMPWLIAGFLACLWLIPVDGVLIKISLPIDPQLDRFLVGGLVVAWLIGRATGRIQPPAAQPVAFKLAVWTFVTVAVMSIVVNAERVSQIGELPLAEKQLAQLFAYVLLGFVVMTSLRAAELRNFGILFVGLACITAVCVVYERQTNYNALYELPRPFLSLFATVPESPTISQPMPGVTPRATIVGPTQHGLAVTAMFSAALPFAILGGLDAKTLGRRAAYACAIGLILAGALTTQRKTAVVAPLLAMTLLLAYRWRDLARLVLPGGVLLVGFIHFVAPGALGTVTQFNSGFFGTATTQGRTTDYDALMPDFLSRPLLGRGYGTLDPDLADTYRILDNEYLGQMFNVGIIGLLAYAAMIICAVAVAHRAIRHGNPVIASPALAAASGVVAFGTASALFDIMSFAQAPYVFFICAGMCTVAAGAAPRTVGVPERVIRAPAGATA